MLQLLCTTCNCLLDRNPCKQIIAINSKPTIPYLLGYKYNIKIVVLIINGTSDLLALEFKIDPLKGLSEYLKTTG